VGLFGLHVRHGRAAERLDPLGRMQCRSSEAYLLIDEAPAGSWERVAAWNAFLHQIYADNLLPEARAPDGAAYETVRVVAELYDLAAGWLERAAELRANPGSKLEVDLRTPLPHWHTPVRTLAELDGMRATLEDARIRVASDLAGFAGADHARGALAARLARVDAGIERVELIWVSRRSEAIRGAIGDALRSGLDGTSVLGQLLARPALLDSAPG
jgi:hypothetical protein